MSVGDTTAAGTTARRPQSTLPPEITYQGAMTGPQEQLALNLVRTINDIMAEVGKGNKKAEHALEHAMKALGELNAGNFAEADKLLKRAIMTRGLLGTLLKSANMATDAVDHRAPFTSTPRHEAPKTLAGIAAPRGGSLATAKTAESSPITRAHVRTPEGVDMATLWILGFQAELGGSAPDPAAVRAFQRANNLVETGNSSDPATRARLRELGTELQRLINERGGNAGRIDGKPGPKTATGLAELQRKAGQEVTHRVGGAPTGSLEARLPLPPGRLATPSPAAMALMAHLWPGGYAALRQKLADPALIAQILAQLATHSGSYIEADTWRKMRKFGLSVQAGAVYRSTERGGGFWAPSVRVGGVRMEPLLFEAILANNEGLMLEQWAAKLYYTHLPKDAEPSEEEAQRAITELAEAIRAVVRNEKGALEAESFPVHDT